LAQFKYRMEGLESEWHEDTGSDRTARYAQLPYGNFTFRVIAANREGVWNEVGASIPVIVVPPFWRTTWFMSLAFLAFVAAGFGTHRVRLGVIERERARQEAFARQLIDSQETDRKRIASDLHDGVSQTLVVIRNWAQIGEPSLPEDSAGRKRMGDIGRAAAQALGEVREVVQDLVPYHLERVGLAEAIREAAVRVADASSLAITCTCADLTGALSTEMSLRLFRVAQDGLNNVVKHSGAHEAWIEITRDSAVVRLTIRDNGKGFLPESIKPTVATDGFGLVGMAERAKMMGGEMAIDSAPGKGTTITITVPMFMTP
jgi:signal transduction histidine kinase